MRQESWKIMTKYTVLILSISVFLANGCASLNVLYGEVIEARQKGNAGISNVYPVTASEAWKITEAVFRWEKTDEVLEHRSENYVLTSTGMKMVAFGSVIGVWMEPVNSGNTKVTVITKRRVQNDRFTQLTETAFHEEFAKGVRIIRNGEQLPAISPP